MSYTQKQLADMEKSLDDDAIHLKAEILELCITLGKHATDAYNGTYQEDITHTTLLRQRLGNIFDALQFLSDAAGDLITAGEPNDNE